MKKRVVSILLVLSVMFSFNGAVAYASEPFYISDKSIEQSVMNLNIDMYLVECGIPYDALSNMSVSVKETLFSQFAPVVVDESKLDDFLRSRAFPESVLSELELFQKVKIHDSLLEIDDGEEYIYGGYSEVIVDVPMMTNYVQGYSAKGYISKTQLKFSAPYVYQSNNLLRYVIYPTYEWIFPYGSELWSDTFSYALHSNYWNCLYDGDFDIYFEHPVYNTYVKYNSLSRPSEVGFCARSYRMPMGIPDVTLIYKGVGCMVVQPLATPLHTNIIFNFSQSFTLPVSISLGSYSISITGFYNYTAEEMTWLK